MSEPETHGEVCAEALEVLVALSKLAEAAQRVVDAPFGTGAHAAGAEPEIAHLRGVLNHVRDAAMSDPSKPTNELTPQWLVTVELDPDDGVPQATEDVRRALLLTLVHLRAGNVILDFTLRP